MSKDLFEGAQLGMTTCWGGSKKAKCIQITKGCHFVLLTQKDMVVVNNVLTKYLNKELNKNG